MKQIFRTYSALNSSVFDLLSGEKEVKQTLGLAYLLSKDKGVLQDFLNLEGLKRILGETNLDNYNEAIIHAELYSINKNKRADIVIQLFKNRLPEKALIIEAKSAKVSSSAKSIINQIEGYLKAEEFPEIDGFNKIFGCSLTKNQLVMHHDKITAISWSTIFKMLSKKNDLASDYLNYVTKIKGAMKFYEKEVFSVPAGKTHTHLYNYPYLYECPNEGVRYTSMKKPLFMAFRKGGKDQGIMEKLFGVEEIIIMNPKTDHSSFIQNKTYSDEVKERVTNYCNQIWGEGNYINEEKQFFILSQTNQIELKHCPKPKANNTFRAYYKLSDLLNENKKIVDPDRD